MYKYLSIRVSVLKVVMSDNLDSKIARWSSFSCAHALSYLVREQVLLWSAFAVSARRESRDIRRKYVWRRSPGQTLRWSYDSAVQPWSSGCCFSGRGTSLPSPYLQRPRRGRKGQLRLLICGHARARSYPQRPIAPRGWRKIRPTSNGEYDVMAHESHERAGEVDATSDCLSGEHLSRRYGMDSI